MFGWIGRLSVRKVAPPVSSRRTQFRPACESLEVRDVPATLTWLGGYNGSIDARVAYNWSADGGATRSPLLPTAGDDIFFDGTVSNVSSVNFSFPASLGGGTLGDPGGTSGDGWLSSLRLLHGYTGTVTYSLPVLTHVLEMRSGELDPGPGVSDLTVDTMFTWMPDPSYPDTAPTLNGTGSLTNTNVIGGTALIDALGLGMVTGSNLLFTSVTVTVNPGTETFNNGAGVVAGNGAQVGVNALQPNVNLTNPNNITYTPNSSMQVQTGATVTVTGPGRWNGNNFLLLNTGGTIDIKGNAVVSFGYQPPPQNATRYDVRQTDGIIKLHAGATLASVSNDSSITGGQLIIVTDAPVGATAPAKIIGNLAVSGSTTTISFEVPSNGWTFEVTGNVTWSGATYKPRVDASTNGQCDTWKVDGTLTIGTGATVQPQFYNYNPNVNNGQLAQGWSWLIIQPTTITGWPAGANAAAPYNLNPVFAGVGMTGVNVTP